MTESKANLLSAALPRRRLGGRTRFSDQLAHFFVLGAALSILVITCALVYVLYSGCHLSREAYGWKFIYGTDWDPTHGELGALPFIYGTVITSFLSLLLAAPLGIGCAIFLSELAPRWMSDSLTFLIELLAAVPSVIYGLLGMYVMIPILRETVVPVLKNTLGQLPDWTGVPYLFKGAFIGPSMLSAGVVLAIMIVPYIVSVSRGILMAVPNEQREGALALGATRWETTWKVVVPWARTGIFGSIFLSLARALGETMAVTLVIGNDPVISASLFHPSYTIAAGIANQWGEASSDLIVHAIIELGLVLFGLTIVINGVARLLIMATGNKERPR